MTRSDSYRVEPFSPGHRPRARATGWLTSVVRRVRIAALVFVLVGFFSLLTGVSPASAGEDGLTWVVTQASGDVRHRTGGFFSTEWQKLRVGDVVGAAAEIQTGRNSRVVLRHRKTTISATSESRLALPGGASFSGAYRVLQSLGTLLYTIKERADGMAVFEVETPYLVALVKGTVFTVYASAEEASVQLREGVVKVRSTDGGTGATLAAGQTARVNRNSGTDVMVSGRGADRRSSVTPPTSNRLAMTDGQPTGPSAGGRTATTASRKETGTARTSTGTKNLAARVRALADRQVAALSSANRGNAGGNSGGSAAAAHDSGVGDPGGGAGDRGFGPGGSPDGGNAGAGGPRGGNGGASSDGGGGTGGGRTGAGDRDGNSATAGSVDGGNPGGGGAGGGNSVGGSAGGGLSGGTLLARSDWSQDEALGATAGRGKARRGKRGTSRATSIWSTAETSVAGIWEGITEGMDTWVGAVWLLAIWAVLWVAVSMLRVTLTKTKKRPPQSGATRGRGALRQAV